MSTIEYQPEAIKAAEDAESQMFDCIKLGKSFVMEAGAGAGKTHALISAIKFLIENKGRELQRKNQRIVCITFTNVAVNEIISRVSNHPAIYVATIHSFCWELIKNFQSDLFRILPTLSDKWGEKFSEAGLIGRLPVMYDLGYRKIEDHRISLHHSDVIQLAVALMEKPKFRAITQALYPYMFIDEYQDTDSAFFESIKTHCITPKTGPLIGFFGDHWQKIYAQGYGEISEPSLEYIGKKVNFRSLKPIVDFLNKMRPELPQELGNNGRAGQVSIFHTNSWLGNRRTGGHWTGDLPAIEAHDALETTKSILAESGWVFDKDQTKILMLTNNVLAQEQGYSQLAAVFPDTESYLKKEDPYIAYFLDYIEPVATAFQSKKYGEMFSVLGKNVVTIRSHADKQRWANDMAKLQEIRDVGTIGEMVAYLKKTGRPKLDNQIEELEKELLKAYENSQIEEIADYLKTILKLKSISYKEVVALSNYVNDNTPFSTKHGVKGAEFENVLVVLGRGWNLYNWGQLLEWTSDGIPDDKRDSYERNRNLFYVACSRPKTRLALLFTQMLSDKALAGLYKWFERSTVKDLYHYDAP